jgi:toxin secretion/phage lysis holin
LNTLSFNNSSDTLIIVASLYAPMDTCAKESSLSGIWPSSSTQDAVPLLATTGIFLSPLDVVITLTEVFLMKEIWNWVQLAFAAIGGFLGWFLGGLDGFLYALIAFVAIDYVTGVLCAIIDKKLSSEIGAKGIFKKVLIFVLVGIAHILDTQILSSTVGSGGVLRTAVIFFYLSNEGVSILENAAHIGLPIPEKLREVLKQLHGREDGDGK